MGQSSPSKHSEPLETSTQFDFSFPKNSEAMSLYMGFAEKHFGAATFHKKRYKKFFSSLNSSFFLKGNCVTVNGGSTFQILQHKRKSLMVLRMEMVQSKEAMNNKGYLDVVLQKSLFQNQFIQKCYGMKRAEPTIGELLCSYSATPRIDVYFEFQERTLEGQILQRRKGERYFSLRKLKKIMRTVLLGGCHIQMIGEHHPELNTRNVLRTAAGEYKLTNIYTNDKFIDQHFLYHLLDKQVGRLLKRGSHGETRQLRMELEQKLDNELISLERKLFYKTLLQDYLENKVDRDYIGGFRQSLFEDEIRGNVLSFGFLVVSAGTLTPFQELFPRNKMVNEELLHEKLAIFGRRYPEIYPLLEQKILLYKEKRKIPMFDELLRYIIDKSNINDLLIEDPDFKPEPEALAPRAPGESALHGGDLQHQGARAPERPHAMGETFQRMDPNQFAHGASMAVSPGAPTSALSNFRRIEYFNDDRNTMNNPNLSGSPLRIQENHPHQNPKGPTTPMSIGLMAHSQISQEPFGSKERRSSLGTREKERSQREINYDFSFPVKSEPNEEIEFRRSIQSDNYQKEAFKADLVQKPFEWPNHLESGAKKEEKNEREPLQREAIQIEGSQYFAEDILGELQKLKMRENELKKENFSKKVEGGSEHIKLNDPSAIDHGSRVTRNQDLKIDVKGNSHSGPLNGLNDLGISPGSQKGKEQPEALSASPEAPSSLGAWRRHEVASECPEPAAQPNVLHVLGNQKNEGKKLPIPC